MRTEALALTLLFPAVALAHQATVSYSELDVKEDEVTGELRFALADLRTQLEVPDLQQALQVRGDGAYFWSVMPARLPDLIQR